MRIILEHCLLTLCLPKPTLLQVGSKKGCTLNAQNSNTLSHPHSKLQLQGYQPASSDLGTPQNFKASRFCSQVCEIFQTKIALIARTFAECGGLGGLPGSLFLPEDSLHHGHEGLVLPRLPGRDDERVVHEPVDPLQQLLFAQRGVRAVLEFLQRQKCCGRVPRDRFD